MHDLIFHSSLCSALFCQIVYLFIYLFFFFTAAPVAYRSSWLRSQIGVADGAYITATTTLDLIHITNFTVA